MNSQNDANHEELKNDDLQIENDASIDKEYKNELENLCADLQNESTDIKRSMDLLKLLDEV